ncbi:hypothetical protein [Telmatospirillum sp. J64-1]|nr:hypothetical protein [Telmatospirillum sp. J64-1]
MSLILRSVWRGSQIRAEAAEDLGYVEVMADQRSGSDDVGPG